MNNTYDTIDKAMLGLSGALITLGVVVLGIVEILAGEPYGAAPVEQTNDAGEVVNTIYPAVDPTIRTGLVIAGLVVLLVWGLYRMATPDVDEDTETVGVTAD
jgi:hypothetical protein